MYNCAYIVILLSAVAVLGKIEDALLVPVSISYEKLLDGNFNRELMVGDFLAPVSVAQTLSYIELLFIHVVL